VLAARNLSARAYSREALLRKVEKHDFRPERHANRADRLTAKGEPLGRTARQKTCINHFAR
jgi:hypothetical protein